MRHVFVETNWVVDWAAPAHHRNPAAVALLERAQRGELQLHMPAICLTEARPPISLRFQPKEAKPLRQFLKWAAKYMPELSDDIAAGRRVLDAFENTIKSGLREVGDRLDSLRETRGLEIFALDDAMLERAVELTALDMQLKPFDQAILAAILVRGDRLTADDASELAFCVLDGDLQPWTKDSKAKQPLTGLYDHARIWVYGDFDLRVPVPYQGWGID